jgi:hypothetical protein
MGHPGRHLGDPGERSPFARRWTSRVRLTWTRGILIHPPSAGR